jgi:DNA-binding transcriptional LysR family regulator
MPRIYREKLALSQLSSLPLRLNSAQTSQSKKIRIILYKAAIYIRAINPANGNHSREELRFTAVIVRNFEYLLALNQERHFARAAASCSVSQPTLSAGIKQLEEDMDVQIVKRGRRFEGFTPEGERVLAWAQQMMDDCMRLKQELHVFKEQSMKGPFRIGVLPSTMALASVLSVPFVQRAPELQVFIETHDAAQLVHKVRQGELDLAVTHLDEVTGEGVNSHALYRESMYFFTFSKAHSEPRLAWERATIGPLCLLRASLSAAMERRLQNTSNVLYTDSIAILTAHLSSGRWSTILPQSLASYLPNSSELRAFALGKEHEQATIGFVSAKLDPLPAPVHAWIELAHTKELVRSIRRMLKSHEPYLLKNKP